MVVPRLAATLVTLALAGLLSGCAQCRVPAIDPTGEGLFSGTTAVNTDLRNCPLIPRAAWTSPPYPPKCDAVGGCATAPLVAPAAVTPAVATATGPYMKLTPTQVVAPVGSEVVLTAGVCGPDGYLVTKEPVEWMISPESVGYIVEVGDDRGDHLIHLKPTSAFKVNTTYALARTTHKPQLISRGTPQADDDVAVKRGQSWISVSSPSEGTSYVTVLAPKEEGWPTRRQTAAIYWVDASWTFPPPVAARAGEKAVLATTVMRTNGTPVAGWTIRYEVLDGPGAAFANGATAIEAPTDANGVAAVELLPTTATQGITRVRVSVIRPASGRGDAPPIAIGQGMTSVSWSSPGLVVAAQGIPDPVPAGGVVKYRVDVANTGDMLTRGVVLSFTPPVGMAVESSNPAGQVFGERVEWRLGDIDAKRQATVEVNCRTSRPGNVRATFRATGGGLTSEGHVDTRVASQAIGLRIISPDRPIAVGQQAEFKIDISNSGRTPLINVVLSDVFGEGLQHSDGAPSPIRRSLGDLQPGEVKKVAVRHIVRLPGRQCHRIIVEADGGNNAELEACVTGVAAGQPLGAAQPAEGQPATVAGRLEVRIVAAAEAREGEQAAYKVEAINAGDEPLTNVRIGMAYSENMKPTDASSDFKLGQHEVYWTLPRLEPGAKEAFDLNAQILGGAERAAVRASASADQVAAQTSDAATIVIPAETPEHREAAKSPRAEPAGMSRLKVTIAESANPARVGQTILYAITVMNEGDGPDEDVSLTLQLPPGIKFGRLLRSPGLQAASPDGRSVDVRPIRTLRANERVSFSLEATAERAGNQTLRVQAISRQHPDGVTTEKETTVK